MSKKALDKVLEEVLEDTPQACVCHMKELMLKTTNPELLVPYKEQIKRLRESSKYSIDNKGRRILIAPMGLSVTNILFENN